MRGTVTFGFGVAVAIAAVHTLVTFEPLGTGCFMIAWVIAMVFDLIAMRMERPTTPDPIEGGKRG